MFCLVCVVVFDCCLQWDVVDASWLPTIVSLPGGAGVCDIEFFPKSHLFVTTSLDSVTRLWTVRGWLL